MSTSAEPGVALNDDIKFDPSDPTRAPMTVSWFCEWQAPGGTKLQLDAPDRRALVSLLSGYTGLTEGHVLTPTSAHDPYHADMSGSPSLVLQLNFAALHPLESGLKTTGQLATLASRDFLPSLANAVISHQAFLSREFSVPNPEIMSSDGSTLTYLVEYPGPASDVNAWHSFYVSHHPPLMTQLPAIRCVEIYTPAVVICDLPFAPRAAMQRNKTVFDSAEAMNAAMLSPVREEMRRDFKNFPPFEGGNTHYPFHTTTVKGPL
jgi:hypothetical protein